MSLYLEDPATEDHLIRCEARRRSITLDAELELYGTSPPSLEFYRFKILKRTPKGAWINSFEGKRFVLLTAAKQYASSTQAEAVNQLRSRKRWRIKILSRQLKDAKEDLALAEQYEA
jgi:hypothetical protein